MDMYFFYFKANTHLNKGKQNCSWVNWLMCFGNKELSRSHNKKVCSLRLQQETQIPFYDMEEILCLDELTRQRGMIQSKQTSQPNVR